MKISEYFKKMNISLDDEIDEETVEVEEIEEIEEREKTTETAKSTEIGVDDNAETLSQKELLAKIDELNSQLKHQSEINARILKRLEPQQHVDVDSAFNSFDRYNKLDKKKGE